MPVSSEIFRNMVCRDCVSLHARRIDVELLICSHFQPIHGTLAKVLIRKMWRHILDLMPIAISPTTLPSS